MFRAGEIRIWRRIYGGESINEVRGARYEVRGMRYEVRGMSYECFVLQGLFGLINFD